MTNYFWFKLCDTLVLAYELPLRDSERQSAVQAAADFVEGQIKCLPVVLRALTMLALSCFQIFVFIKYGRRFVDLPPETRKEEIENWERFEVLPLGKLFVSIRSLSVLHFFEQPCVQAALDI